MEAGQLVGHELGLVDFVVGLEALDGLAHAGVGPEVLRLAAEVVGDDRVRRVEDGLGRPIVLLEQDHGGVGEGVFELEDVSDVGTTEAIHTLIVVADHGDRAMFRGEPQHQLVLDAVGVLVLVDQQHRETSAVVIEDVGVFAEQQCGVEEEIVEVHRSGLREAALIFQIDVGDLAFETGSGLIGISLGAVPLVLRRADRTVHAPGSEALLVEAQIADHVAGEPAGIGLVVDGEARGIAQHRSFAPQDPDTRRVEGGNPHLVGDGTDQRLDALLHLVGCLVGEGDRQDLERRLPLLDRIGDSAGEHSGLARARPGHHQERAAGMHHSVELGGVESVEDVLTLHPLTLGGGTDIGIAQGS